MQGLLMCHSPDEKSIIIIHSRHIPCFERNKEGDPAPPGQPIIVPQSTGVVQRPVSVLQ